MARCPLARFALVYGACVLLFLLHPMRTASADRAELPQGAVAALAWMTANTSGFVPVPPANVVKCQLTKPPAQGRGGAFLSVDLDVLDVLPNGTT